MTDLDRLWDVVIVGAGPAGATAAIAARRKRPGAEVLLLDRDDFPRDKSCGDGIAPHVVDALARLGVTGLVDGWEPVRTLELSLGDHGTSRGMARPVWVIPRTVFDARLVEAAVDRGARLARHRVRKVQVGEDVVVLDGTIKTRTLIGADGANSVVRGTVEPGRRKRTAIGLRGYAPTPAARAGRQVIRFAEDGRLSYAWAFDRGDGWSNVGYGEFLGNGHPAPSRRLLHDRLEQLLPGSTTGGRDWRGHHLPLSGFHWSQPNGRVLLAGDAAGLVNPMTGEGITHAVLSGASAGAAAVTAGPGAGALHRRTVRSLLATNLMSTALAARLISHPRLLRGGLDASQRDQRIFDDLVELGLGDGHLTPRVVVGALAHAIRTPG